MLEELIVLRRTIDCSYNSDVFDEAALKHFKEEALKKLDNIITKLRKRLDINYFLCYTD